MTDGLVPATSRGPRLLARLRQFVRFCWMRHPAEVGEAEVERFLCALAGGGKGGRGVAAATQNQAASALQFLYAEVLARPLGRALQVVRAKEPGRLPVVLTPQEVKSVLACMRGVPQLVAMLLYGSGLRLLEALTLRVKDVDFGRGEVVVRRGKGDKDRVTMLPVSVRAPVGGGHSRAGDVPRLSPFVCDPSARGRLRHSHGAGAAGPSRRAHDDDLYPRPEPWRPRRAQPSGLSVIRAHAG